MVASKSQDEDRRFGRPSYGKPKSQLTVFGKALRQTLRRFPTLYAVDISAVIRARGFGKTTPSQITGIKNGSQNLRATSVQDIILGLREKNPEAFEFYLNALVNLLRDWEPSQDDDDEVSMGDVDNLVDFIKDWMQREGISQSELISLCEKEGISTKAIAEILEGRQVNEETELPRLARVIRQPNGEIYSIDEWRVLCGYPPAEFVDQENGHPLGNGKA